MLTQFYNFLIFCSGCDPDVLSECPKSEKVKFSSIGATILFTGILACFSGGYALYTIFQDLPFSVILSISFGILWGGIIFNIDRYLVSSLKKQGNMKRELLLATPRFLMAIIISLVVSKPLEVRIFQQRITAQIHQNKINAALHDKQKIDSLFDQSLLGNRLSQDENDLRSLQEKKDKGDPETPEFNELLSNLKAARADLNATSNVDSRRINELNESIDLIRRERTFYDQNNTPELPTDAESKIQSLSSRKSEFINEINNKVAIVSKLQNSIDAEREAYENEIAHRINKAEKLENKTEASKIVSDSLTKIETSQGDTSRAISYKSNFITQMEALGDLTDKRFSTMWWTSLLISALILLIEVSPIVAKLLSDRGPYDEKIQTRDLKIADYEKAEREINTIIAGGIYLSDNILLRKVEHYTNTAKKSTETLLDFVNSNHEQSKAFEGVVTDMDEDIQEIANAKLKANYANNQTTVIDIYDNFRNKIFELYKKILGGKDDVMGRH